MIIVKPKFKIEPFDGVALITRLEERYRAFYDDVPLSRDPYPVSKHIRDSNDNFALDDSEIRVYLTCDLETFAFLNKSILFSFRWRNFYKSSYEEDDDIFYCCPPCLPDIQEGQYDLNRLTSIKDYLSEISFVWMKNMIEAEVCYKHLIKNGMQQSHASTVLPSSVEVELSLFSNLCDWRQNFKYLEEYKGCHVWEVMSPILLQLKKDVPVIFDDIKCD